MNRIIRCITSDGCVMASAIDSTEMIKVMQEIHGTSAVASAALGRVMTGCSLMGSKLKGADSSITLRVNGGGPLGSVVAVSDYKGNCRGYVVNPTLELPLKPNGKLDVSAAVGTNGTISVLKDFGSGEPYMGQSPLVTGEIAEDITSYYAKSEQLPTVCALGVLTDKDSHDVILAGGILIQLLPAATDESIDMLEKNLETFEPVTTMLAKGMSLEDICNTALKGFEVEFLDEFEINYVCNCSKERVENAIAMISPKELQEIIDEGEPTNMECHFCNKNYTLSINDIKRILKRRLED